MFCVHTHNIISSICTADLSLLSLQVCAELLIIMPLGGDSNDLNDLYVH